MLIAPQIGSAQTLPKITIGVEQATKPRIQSNPANPVFNHDPVAGAVDPDHDDFLFAPPDRFSFRTHRAGDPDRTGQPDSDRLSLFLTFFIMRPVIDEMNDNALQPYLSNQIDQRTALQEAGKPIKLFMLKQTRPKELELFHRLSNEKTVQSPEELSLATVIPAFMISEIKTAFQIGFLIYLPMLLIDMIVASVLLSMGMMMLPPTVISMPLKILLFVLVDGWYLVVESLVKGFK
jgi:flagellar biosynthetic protein FliP